MKQLNKSLTMRFKKIDALGTSKSFTVNGSESYRSTVGAVLTILIYLLIAVYASDKAYKLSDRLDTNHQQSFQLVDADTIEEITFE